MTSGPTEPGAETCGTCRATVYQPGPEIAAVCEKTPCPYFRLRR